MGNCARIGATVGRMAELAPLWPWWLWQEAEGVVMRWVASVWMSPSLGRAWTWWLKPHAFLWGGSKWGSGMCVGWGEEQTKLPVACTGMGPHRGSLLLSSISTYCWDVRTWILK